MKKTIVTIMMVSVALFFTQCRKSVDTINPQPSGEMMDVTLCVDNGGSKTVIDASGNVTWKLGDRIYIVGETQGLLGYATALTAGKPVYFSGKITALTSDQALRFYYVGDKTFTLDGSGNYTFDISSQDGTLTGIADHNQLAFGKSAGEVAVGTSHLGTIKMKSLTAIVHTNINYDGNAVDAVTVTGGFATSTFNAQSYDGTSAVAGTQGEITMTFTAPTVSTDCYLALLPGTQTLTFSCSDGEGSLDEKEVAANGFYNGGGDDAVEVDLDPIVPGVLPGLFTINSSGDKVRFSQGNLQYIGSASPAYWKFAENQYDYIGESQETTDINIDRDFFGWGATGSWDDRSAVTNGTPTYQLYYFPYSTDKVLYVSTTYNPYGYGPDGACSLSVEHFSDWGYNKIQNGGNANNCGWRTLSLDEWEYMLKTRKVTVSSGQKASYGQGKVNGVKGLIILPDNWDGTVCSGFKYGTSSWSNTFTEETMPKWSDMEAAGVVFLPAAGYRDKISVVTTGYCYYWSSSCIDKWRAYHIYCISGGLSFPANNRYFGCMVRLVWEEVVTNGSSNAGAGDLNDGGEL